MEGLWIVLSYMLVLAATIALGINMAKVTNPWWARFLLFPALFIAVLVFWIEIFSVLS